MIISVAAEKSWSFEKEKISRKSRNPLLSEPETILQNSPENTALEGIAFRLKKCNYSDHAAVSSRSSK